MGRGYGRVAWRSVNRCLINRWLVNRGTIKRRMVYGWDRDGRCSADASAGVLSQGRGSEEPEAERDAAENKRKPYEDRAANRECHLLTLLGGPARIAGLPTPFYDCNTWEQVKIEARVGG